ncbi:MAG: DNA gyrase inhibitor YacG [Sedimentisphaerales bacterium]|nr:DNA gyrase inhibitor YacG [Sedimentisphaerales bacterium]
MAFECPICKKPVCIPQSGQRTFFPFCSDRCRLIDLGKWLDGEYRVPVNSVTQSNSDTSDSLHEAD